MARSQLRDARVHETATLGKQIPQLRLRLDWWLLMDVLSSELVLMQASLLRRGRLAGGKEPAEGCAGARDRHTGQADTAAELRLHWWLPLHVPS